MKILQHYLLSLIALFGVVLVQAQTADEIIAKHIEASGGKDKINQIKSIYIESTIQVMGNDAPSTTTILNGKGFRSESEFNGQKVIQVYTDKGGWAVNPFAGGSDAQAMPDGQYKAGRDQIFIGGPLYDYASKGYKVEYLGMENVGTVSNYKLKLVAPDTTFTTFYIDPTTYYISKIVKTTNMMGQDMVLTISLSNYQKTDFGYTVPFGTETSFGEQFTMSGTVKKVEFNKDVDPKIFDMPK
jgi:outer membrane lipoprotein-sorting protein